MKENRTAPKIIHFHGRPNPKQKVFFESRAKYTAYGGARGGGKSWALRRKLIGLCLNYPGIVCLLVRRTLPELKSNHIRPMQKEYGEILTYSESEKAFSLPNGSKILFGYCSCDRDVLRYQGQEYDIIAIDEATQLSEYQFSIFKACLRGTNAFPRRMYLTCNPGGIGHAWVKRLFIDREFNTGEDPCDYLFVSATVYDNSVLTSADPEYVRSLESLPPKMREAWLDGRWDVFEGQFLTEFNPEIHVCDYSVIPNNVRYYVAFDYGFDMLAALLVAYDREGGLYVIGEHCESNLTLSAAAEKVVDLCSSYDVEYVVASPDLWNRRQDSGKSGFEIMQAVCGMPPMTRADNRRVPGWRILREYLNSKSGEPRLHICRSCPCLIRCLPALLCDRNRPEDASDEPHSVTHAPEALRYAVMSRVCVRPNSSCDFRFPGQKSSMSSFFD